MGKRVFGFIYIVFFVLILSFHYSLNFEKVSQPPSKEWSKESLISTGFVQSNPSAVKFNDKYAVMHSDGNKIKLLMIDSVGKKLKEKYFDAKTELPLATNLITDGKNLYLYWTVVEDGVKNINTLKVDENFEPQAEGQIGGIDEVAQVGDNIIAINFKNKITIIDKAINQSFDVSTGSSSYISGARTKTGILVAFKEEGKGYKYFTYSNGSLSKVMFAGTLEETSAIAFINSVLAADDNYGYMFMEFRNKGEFGGTKLLKFSLKQEGNFKADDFKINKSKVEIADIISYYSEGSAKFLARMERPFDKKRYYEDIMEYDVTKGGSFTLVSRTREITMMPFVTGDTVFFCDAVGKDKFDIYMASKEQKIVEANKGIKGSEIKQSVILTANGFIYSLVYVLLYGLLWIVPSIAMLAVYSLFEYKMQNKAKKIWAIIMYVIFFAFKAVAIHLISYERFGYFLPTFMTFGLSLSISAVISILGGIHAYYKYSRGMESNVGAMSLLTPMTYDSVLSLMVLVPFIV